MTVLLRIWSHGLVAAAIALTAFAASAADVVVSTRVCEPVPKGADVQLSPADDADLYQSVDRPLREALAKAGHAISKAGPVDLYYTITEAPVAIRRSGPSLGTLEVDTTRRGQRALLLLNVWSTRKDSILGGRKSKSGSQYSTYLFMSFEVNDKKSGKCLWRGEGGTELVGDRKVLISLITETVLDHLGQAVDGKSVVVD